MGTWITQILVRGIDDSYIFRVFSALWWTPLWHCSDVIMGMMASQIISLANVHLTVYSDQRKFIKKNYSWSTLKRGPCLLLGLNNNTMHICNFDDNNITDFDAILFIYYSQIDIGTWLTVGRAQWCVMECRWPTKPSFTCDNACVPLMDEQFTPRASFTNMV